MLYGTYVVREHADEITKLKFICVGDASQTYFIDSDLRKMNNFIVTILKLNVHFNLENNSECVIS